MLVLTMFAVAVGSLSQARAALASPRLPGSIATHSAPGAVQDRRATGTASAPQLNSAVPLAELTFTSADSATFTVGQAGTFTVTTTGSPTPILYESGALPPGVTFTDNGNGTATLSGTPTTAGTYAFTIAVANFVKPFIAQHFTLTVNQVCQITSSAAATFTTSLAGTFTVTTTGSPACALSATGLPAGVTFTDNGDGTGTISGTPTTAGTSAFTITATNGVSPGATQNFILTVAGGPHAACRITSPAVATFTVGQAGTSTVTSTGYPLCQLSETGALPAGVTFSSGNGTATLAGTPAANTGGTYTFTIIATNVAGYNTQSFTLTVKQACQITSSAAATITTTLPGTFTVTTTGLATCALSETGTLPSGVTLTDNGNGTGTISGTPTTVGTYPVTITATNSVGPAATQTFTLTVNAAQACAITSAGYVTFTVGQPGSFTVTTTGSPKCTLSATSLPGIGLPSWLTLTDNGNGTATLSGTPPASPTGGTDTFPITAANGVGSDTQDFSLSVLQACTIASSAGATFTAGQAGTFTVATTGVPACALSETATLPSWLTLTDNGNGTATLAGTPAPGSGGTHKFTITATNGVSPDAIQSFTLIVVGPPVAPSGLKATGKGKTVSLTWTNHASAPSAATAIQIQRSTNVRFTTAVTTTTVGPAVTTHIDKTVVKGKKYYYRVRADNAAGDSAWSTVSTVTAP